MNAQEIFDTVATHLFKQGQQSIDKDNWCFYRHPQGLTCAVGVMIEDNFYDTGMEGLSVEGLVDSYVNLPTYFDENVDLLKDLQIVHDSKKSWADTDSMRVGLFVVALSHKLDNSILNTLSFEWDKQ